MDLKKRLETKQAVAGVIGLGYVGLPLAVELARRHVRTIGFDVDTRKVSERAAGRSYIPDVPFEHVAEAVNAGMLTPTTDPSLPGGGGCHRHLRADAAAEDEGPGQ